eukprot:CAMPEP_0170198412 /NCGR_PEP_ID=MMETSP0040_2-20121228/68740_1 /TAXON_ID=641309 /ORGANISM="Lotharella oceanica, Strain CCMP622" /LENGTH=72 /DNA_ID=CAMNT_0010448365 /DNA_START=1202 /DNA_END=1420 /DNA_ORIENTATION=+
MTRNVFYFHPFLELLQNFLGYFDASIQAKGEAPGNGLFEFPFLERNEECYRGEAVSFFNLDFINVEVLEVTD